MSQASLFAVALYTGDAQADYLVPVASLLDKTPVRHYLLYL